MLLTSARTARALSKWPFLCKVAAFERCSFEDIIERGTRVMQVA